MLKESRRGLLIFSIIMILYGLLIVSIFPSFEKSLSNPSFEGSGIKLEEIENNKFNLTWDFKRGYPNHIATGAVSVFTYANFYLNYTDFELTDDLAELDINSSLGEYSISILYNGSGNHVTFNNTDNYQAFLVVYITGDWNISNATISEIVTLDSLMAKGAFDEYLKDNPMMEGMMGGNIVNMYELRGFLVLEFFSIWPLVMAIYFSIMGLSSITKNVEERSIDVLMATGYTRDRFLVEKTQVILAKFVIISISALLGLVIGTMAIGRPVPWAGFIFAFVGGIPFGLAFIAIGCLASVFINEYKRGLGIIMGAVFVQYVFQIVSNISTKAEFLKWFSMFTYWDAGELMIDEKFSLINIIIPLVLAIVVYMISLHYFRKKEIPV